MSWMTAGDGGHGSAFGLFDPNILNVNNVGATGLPSDLVPVYPSDRTVAQDVFNSPPTPYNPTPVPQPVTSRPVNYTPIDVPLPNVSLPNIKMPSVFGNGQMGSFIALGVVVALVALVFGHRR